MPPPIVDVDTSVIRDGKHRELEVAMKRLAVFVEQNMPRVISYGFFLNEDRAQMTVIAVHPDSESLEFHMDTGADEFRNFADLIDLSRIEVYGAVLARPRFVAPRLSLRRILPSAQILAWAVIFGYAQQVFTRLVDDQGKDLLSDVAGRGAAGDRPTRTR